MRYSLLLPTVAANLTCILPKNRPSIGRRFLTYVLFRRRREPATKLMVLNADELLEKHVILHLFPSLLMKSLYTAEHESATVYNDG